MIHSRGLSTGRRAWRRRSACCSRMSRCSALSRAYRPLGFRRGLGVDVGIWSGRRTPCRRLIDAERAIDHGESRTSASRATSREIYANRIPLRDPACRGLADIADQWISAGQAAEQQLRSTLGTSGAGPGEPGTGASKSDVTVPADRGSSATCQEDMRPRNGQGDDAHAVWELSGDTRSRSTDLKIPPPARDVQSILWATQPDTRRSVRAEVPDHKPNASRWWHREGKSNHGCL